MRGSTPAKPLQSTIEREQQAEINIIDANGKGATITFINTIASQPRLDPQPSPSSIARSIYYGGRDRIRDLELSCSTGRCC